MSGLKKKIFFIFLLYFAVYFFILLLHCYPFLYLDAQNKNLPSLEYVLYPKPSGLLCCLTTLVEKHESSGIPNVIESDSNKSEIEIDNDEKRKKKYSEGKTANDRDEIPLRNGINNGFHGNNSVSVNSLNSGSNNMKEHKSERVMYVQEDTAYLRGNESKDGHNNLLKSREIGKDIGKGTEQNKVDLGNLQRGGEQLCENVKNNKQEEKMKIIGNENEKEELNENNSILFLHDLTIAYKDFKKGKRTSDKSIILGKYLYIFFNPFQFLLISNS